MSWLMDSGLFQERFPLPEARKERAMEEVRRMGYEYHISSAKVEGQQLRLTVENRGVAPFYADWPVEVEFAWERNRWVVRKPGLAAGTTRILGGVAYLSAGRSLGLKGGAGGGDDGLRA